MMKRIVLWIVMMMLPVSIFVAGRALVASPERVKTVTTMRAPARLAPCMDDPRMAAHDLRVLLGVVADCDDAIPEELRVAARSSVIAPQKERASILFAAARKDTRFRSPCDTSDTQAADPLLDHPRFEECATEGLRAHLALSCRIDIGTYVFLDVLAAHFGEASWTMTRAPSDVELLVEEGEWLCPHAEILLPPPPPPRPKPAPVKRSGGVWPFHAWDRAEAVTFNQFGQQPRIQLYAYDGDGGWSEHLAERKPLERAGADRAIALVNATLGGVEVSKCPFPRHALVLYDGDVPVASINVCFECGDVLIWPKMPAPAYDSPAWPPHYALQLKLHERTFPKWKTFFRDDVGFPVQ